MTSPYGPGGLLGGHAHLGLQGVPTMPSPLSHDHLGFHPMLLNAQLALQAAAVAAAMATSATPTSSIFSTPTRTTPSLDSYLSSFGRPNGMMSSADAGTLLSMEKMVAGINGNSGATSAE
jgi:hypothetical protein